MNHDHRDLSKSGKERSDFDDSDEDADEDTRTLSPAVRRLVKQYDLDITAIRGSGPSGRIRVGDVMAMLGSRAGLNSAIAAGRGSESRLTSARDADILCETRDADILCDTRDADGLRETREADILREAGAVQIRTAAEDMNHRVAPRLGSALATTVFECDIASIAAHRQRERERGVDISLASYFLTACSATLRAVPEANAADGPIHLIVYASAAERPTVTIVRNADELPLEAMSGVLAAAAKSSEVAPQPSFACGESSAAAPHEGPGRATFAVHDYASSGCVLAMPTPLGAGHAASLGIGRVRRRVVVRNVNGEDVPRPASLCYLTLTYDPQRLTLERANLWLANLVRLLERWSGV